MVVLEEVAVRLLCPYHQAALDLLPHHISPSPCVAFEPASFSSTPITVQFSMDRSETSKKQTIPIMESTLSTLIHQAD